MDKLLIKLLNEYLDWRDFVFVDHDPKLDWFDVLIDWKSEFIADETVFCIKFWFIEWLVNNDHIDLDECMESEDYKELSRNYEVEDVITMVLAIHYSAYDLLLERIK